MKPRTTSLKWKIAASYAALLALVLVVTSGVLVWRFDAIISAQARARADATMAQVVAVANPAGPLGLQDVSSGRSPLQVLLNSDNLAYWASPYTAIEIDTPAGYPMVKSSNLGGGRIPPAQVDARHPAVFYDAVVAGEPAVVEARYVRIAGTTDAIVAVSESLATVSTAIAQARATVIVVLLAAIVAVVLLSIVLASQAINPINELSRAMREIGFERLDRRLSWPRDDEIGELAQSFDDLLARLEASFARERQFVSDASHELKTPLTSINANAQMLLRWAESDERVRRESLETIAHESASVGEMVNGMLTLAKADRGDAIPKEPVSLIEEAREVVKHATPRAKEKGLDLTFEQASGSAIVLGDANLIRQLIGNLVDNAIKFTEKGGVDVRAGSDDGTGWLEVRDTGPGIAERDVPRVFERFYRADRSRTRSVPGTGLGLAIVRSIARVHGGNVGVERARGGGSLFRVTIPLLALLAAILFGALPRVARADDVATTASPVINVALTSGSLTIHTWNRAAVHIETVGSVSWKQFDAQTTAPRIPSSIDSWAVTLPTERGVVSLPAEHFVLPPLAPGPHDAVTATGSGDTTIIVPQGTALLVVRTGQGTLSVDNYRGVLVAHVRRGGMNLSSVSGTAYAQVVVGRIVVLASTFDRLRARTAVGGLFFEGCAARQIDVTAVHGTIVYDNGLFTDGPAYFSTGDGAIAIGVAGGSATVDGRSGLQDVALAVPTGTAVARHGTDTTVEFAGGGPFVTASAQGTVAIYDGGIVRHTSLLSRLQLPSMVPSALFRAGPPRFPGRFRRSFRRPPR